MKGLSGGDEGTKYPGSMNAFFRIVPQTSVPGIYTTTTSVAHQLSESTLIDSCGAEHLVNSISMLEAGTFKRSEHPEWVEAGTTSFPIQGRGIRVLKNVLNGPKGPKTEHLTLSNVVVVEGFHVNIISEARLTNQGMWFLGLDTTLRYGTLADNVVLAKLERRHNLVFLEYKPLTTYPSDALIFSAAGIMLLPVTVPSTHKSHSEVRHRMSKDSGVRFKSHVKARRARVRHSKAPRPEREDSEHSWHLRTGCHGADSVRAGVFRAVGVRINGTKRIDCSHCATTHSTRVVSRRTSERRSRRPFWRVSWDIFTFPISGLTRKRYVLLLKDEYSGMLYAFFTSHKTGDVISELLQAFEARVHRQYGLRVCIFRSDNDTSVITTQEEHMPKEYEAWCEREGIIIETSPSATHEPNGGAERAGKEAIPSLSR